MSKTTRRTNRILSPLFNFPTFFTFLNQVFLSIFKMEDFYLVAKIVSACLSGFYANILEIFTFNNLFTKNIL